MPQLRKTGKRATAPVYHLGVEAVYGCANRCPQCEYGALPEKPSFAEKKVMDRAMGKLALRLKPRLVGFTLRGEPLSHPDLHGLTRLVRKHFPEAENIYSFWGFGGADSRGALVKRTRGLDTLVLSLDAHHYNSLRKRLPERKGETPRENRERAFAELRERIKWGIAASQKNGFKLHFRLTGPEREQELMKEVIRTAFAEAGRDPSGMGVTYSGHERGPRGNLNEHPETPHAVNLFHDGRIDSAWLPTRRAVKE